MSQGRVALVDDEDYNSLIEFTWSAGWYDRAKTFYAQRKSPMLHGQRTSLFMHRVVLGAKRGQQVDHRDHDGLNNQRSNLRIATPGQNQANKRKNPDRFSSPHKGVSFNRQQGKWKAQIKTAGISRFLGWFDDEEDAARAYDVAAVEVFGEFALLNLREDIQL